MSKWNLLAVTVLAAVGSTAVAQKVTFETGTRLVMVDVAVRNGDNVTIPGLTKDDFVLKDKGKEREIQVFDIRESGVAPGAPTPMPPNVASNRLNKEGQTMNSATVMLYDKINSTAQNQGYLREQLLKALSTMDENQYIGVYALDFNIEVVRDFNEPLGILKQVAQQMRDGKSVDDLSTDEEKLLFAKLDNALKPMQELAHQAKVNRTYPRFKSIARHIAGVPGAKNIIWLTSSFPLTFGTTRDKFKNDQAEVQNFLNVLTNYNISIFPVDPRGTGAALNTTETTGTDATILNSGAADSATLTPAGNSLNPNPGGIAMTNQSDSLSGWSTMELLGLKTGGKDYRNRNDIAPVIGDVVAATKVIYTLGFYADKKDLDDKVHDLKVELKGDVPKGTKPYYRQEFVAYKLDSKAEQEQVPDMGTIIADPLSTSDIGLLGVSNPDPNKPGAQKVDVRVTLSDLTFERRGDHYVGQFALGMAVEGVEGGLAKNYPMDLTEAQFQQAMTSGVDLSNSIETKEGTGGFIRVAVQDKLTGRSGVIRVPYQVPAAE